MSDKRYPTRMHEVLAVEAYGPIPKDCAIIFMDQDRGNITLDNLRMVKRKYLSIANRFRMLRHSAALTETGLIVAELKAMSSEARKKQREGML